MHRTTIQDNVNNFSTLLERANAETAVAGFDAAKIEVDQAAKIQKLKAEIVILQQLIEAATAQIDILSNSLESAHAKIAETGFSTAQQIVTLEARLAELVSENKALKQQKTLSFTGTPFWKQSASGPSNQPEEPSSPESNAAAAAA